MEFKSGMITIVLTLLLLTVKPISCQGEPDKANSNTEIYDIDYRGPETHSYFPPPNSSGRRASLRHRTVVPHPKFKDLRVHNGKTIHG